MAGGIQVYIGASVADLVSGLKDAQGQVQRFAQGAKRDLGSVGPAANEAASGFGTLGHTLAEYKREQVQEGRLVGFYVRELRDFTGMSGQAADAVGGVVQAMTAFAGGVTIGAIFEVAKVGVAAIRWATEQAHGEIDKLNQAIDAAVARAKQGQGDAAEQWYQKALASGDEGAAYREAAAAFNKEKGSSEAYAKVIVAQGLATEEAARKNGTYLAGMAQEEAAYAKVRAELDKLQEARARMRRELHLSDLSANSGPEVGAGKGQEDSTGVGKALAAQESERIRSIKARYAAEAQQNQMGFEAYRQVRLAEMDLDEQVFAQRAALAREGREEEHRQGEALYRDSLQRQAAEEDEKRKRIANAQQTGEAIGTMMGQLATGQMTFGQVMAQVGQMVIQSVVRTAIANVTAHAVTAGAGAAESQASIPYVGPILAISAMGAILTAVMGLLGNLPSAAGGWTIPRGLNPLVQAHGGEHIIPADIAERYEQGAPGGGGGVTLNIQALDGKAARGYLHQNRRALAREIRGLVRNGRLS